MAVQWLTLLLVVSPILRCSAAHHNHHHHHHHHHDAPKPPVWPSQFEVNFTFSVPYLKRFQKEGLVYQYRIWQDTERGQQRMERGTAVIPDLETVIEDQNQNKMWTIFVHKTQRECKVDPLNGGSGPTLSEKTPLMPPAVQTAASAAAHGHQTADSAALSSVAQSRRLRQWKEKSPLTYVLPDVTHDQWKFGGKTKEDGETLHAWVFKSEPGHMGYGHYRSNYTLTVTKEGVPKKLDIWGINPYTGGHFDHYIATYSGFEAEKADASVFKAPPLCETSTSHSLAGGARGTLPGDMRKEILAWLPAAHYGDTEYDKHVQLYGKRHSSHAEYLTRRQNFDENSRFVKEWNRGQKSHKNAHVLELNHWGDVSTLEYATHLEGNRRQRREWAAKGYGPYVYHQPTLARHMLPSTVDWRGSPANSPVKNQAACGSCWAFGAVGALETAYYRSKGEQRLFSEQNLVDCSWDIPDGKLSNKGCYDGYQQIAFEYVWRTGGIAAETDYPYIGVSGFCNTSVPLIKMSNGTTVHVRGGEQGLMEALVTKGPMTVAVDAGHESFRFYKSGIYNNTACTTKPVTDLDHAVLVSGYGEEDGSKYWIVKNTWSSHWGEEGYIRIAREPADCGIATEPLYVEFDLSE